MRRSRGQTHRCCCRRTHHRHCVIDCEKKHRVVVVITVTATVTAERFVKPDFNKKKTTKQSTTMRKPVRNKERKTSSTLGLSIVCGKSGIQKRKQKKVKNWKERKVHVDHNQFTIKELWERKSIELRNDQLCSLFNENMSRREAHCYLKIFL